MENLTKKLSDVANFHLPHDLEEARSALPPVAEQLREAAIIWSKACLMEFRDDLLRKGLMVSAAIGDFLAELEASVTS